MFQFTLLRASAASEAIHELRDCFGVYWDMPRNDGLEKVDK